MDVGLLQVKGEISCSNKTSTPYTFVVQGATGFFSICRSHNSVSFFLAIQYLSQKMTFQRILNMNSTRVVASGAGLAHPFGVLEFHAFCSIFTFL
jgi:hypothetical protein